MKCQILFSGRINNVKYHQFAESAQRAVKVKSKNQRNGSKTVENN